MVSSSAAALTAASGSAPTIRTNDIAPTAASGRHRIGGTTVAAQITAAMRLADEMTNFGRHEPGLL